MFPVEIHLGSDNRCAKVPTCVPGTDCLGTDPRPPTWVCCTGRLALTWTWLGARPSFWNHLPPPHCLLKPGGLLAPTLCTWPAVRCQLAAGPQSCPGLGHRVPSWVPPHVLSCCGLQQPLPPACLEGLGWAAAACLDGVGQDQFMDTSQCGTESCSSCGQEPRQPGVLVQGRCCPAGLARDCFPWRRKPSQASDFLLLLPTLSCQRRMDLWGHSIPNAVSWPQRSDALRL